MLPADLENIVFEFARNIVRERLFCEMNIFFEFAQFKDGTPDQMCVPNYDDQEQVDFINDQPECFQTIGYHAWRLHTSYPIEQQRYIEYFSEIPRHFY